MNESFSDLSVLGSEVKTNREVTPFINSLSNNTIKGYALSSVYGGETPNSEYEFLTGNSLMFLPTGSIVYQQFIHRPVSSMISQLKNLDFHCIAMHPYLSSGWARTSVYPYLGFDEYYFLDDFPKDSLIRDYISDFGMYKKLINVYKEKKLKNENIFIFGVTMQNHGGYDYKGSDFEQTISIRDYNENYDDANQYLSLIHESDRAIEYLINYFDSINDEVAIVFFGDHLPKLNDSFYEEIHEGTFKTLDEQQLKHTIPFFIWTNYDINEQNVGLTSLNFLSNYVYEAANIQLPEYNSFLSDVQKEIPTMNANGYYSVRNRCFRQYKEAEGREKDILNLYNQLQYNNMFDDLNRNEVLFPIAK